VVADPSTGTDDDDIPLGELPAGPRPPSIHLVTLLAVSGVVLLLAPFVFAAVTSRRQPRPTTPDATARVSESAAVTSFVTF